MSTSFSTLCQWPARKTSPPSASSTASTRAGWDSTRGGLYKTEHPLAEARVIYELGANGGTATGALKRRLAIDAGQLSRLLKRLEAEGLVSKQVAPLDARRQHVRLTEAGQATFERMDRRSDEEVGGAARLALGAGAGAECDAPVRAAMERERKVELRGLEPGDLGWLVERHGVLYAREYGWDQSFERLVAKHRGQLRPQHRPRVDRDRQRPASRCRSVRAPRREHGPS